MEKFKTSVTSQLQRRCSARTSLSQSYSQYITHLELDLPPAQEDDDQLDKEQMLWMRKRGGLLQPDWILRTINQDPKMTWNQEKQQRTELENILKFITEYYLRKQEKTSAFFMRG